MSQLNTVALWPPDGEGRVTNRVYHRASSYRNGFRSTCFSQLHFVSLHLALIRLAQMDLVQPARHLPLSDRVDQLNQIVLRAGRSLYEIR
jgi:hypothetical protein